MGCFSSKRANSRENQWRTKHSSYPSLRDQVTQQKPVKPRFGQYRCICGRTWNSCLSWQGNYQICKRCKRSVYPCSQRDLRPSDISDNKEKNKQHPKELCQRCKQLDSYCGKGQNIKPLYKARRRF